MNSPPKPPNPRREQRRDQKPDRLRFDKHPRKRSRPAASRSDLERNNAKKSLREARAAFMSKYERSRFATLAEAEDHASGFGRRAILMPSAPSYAYYFIGGTPIFLERSWDEAHTTLLASRLQPHYRQLRIEAYLARGDRPYLGLETRSTAHELATQYFLTISLISAMARRYAQELAKIREHYLDCAFKTGMENVRELYGHVENLPYSPSYSSSLRDLQQILFSRKIASHFEEKGVNIYYEPVTEYCNNSLYDPVERKDRYFSVEEWCQPPELKPLPPADDALPLAPFLDIERLRAFWLEGGPYFKIRAAALKAKLTWHHMPLDRVHLLPELEAAQVAFSIEVSELQEHLKAFIKAVEKGSDVSQSQDLFLGQIVKPRKSRSKKLAAQEGVR